LIHGIPAFSREPRSHNFKDQLLIVLVNRLGGEISIPVAEIDATGPFTLSFNIDNGAFNFTVGKKQ